MPAMYKRSGQIFAELKSETRPRDLIKQMSGGQRQAVAIARTRLSDPKIVLMDEPTAAISVRQVAEVLSLIRRLRDQGIAVVLISHRMPGTSLPLPIASSCCAAVARSPTARLPIVPPKKSPVSSPAPSNRFEGYGRDA